MFRICTGDFGGELRHEPQYVYGPGSDCPLDRAILNAADTIKADLEEGAVVAVLDFNSGNSRFDDYVMQELEIALVSGKRLEVTERKNIEQVRKEKRNNYWFKERYVSSLGLGMIMYLI